MGFVKSTISYLQTMTFIALFYEDDYIILQILM